MADIEPRKGMPDSQLKRDNIYFPAQMTRSGIYLKYCD